MIHMGLGKGFLSRYRRIALHQMTLGDMSGQLDSGMSGCRDTVSTVSFLKLPFVLMYYILFALLLDILLTDANNMQTKFVTTSIKLTKQKIECRGKGTTQ